MIHDLLADVPTPEYIRVLAEILRGKKLQNNEYVKTKINPVINEFSAIGIYNYLANMEILDNYDIDVFWDFMNVSLYYVEIVKIVTRRDKWHNIDYGYFVIHPYDTFDVYIVKTNSNEILNVPLGVPSYIPEAIQKFYNNQIKREYSLEDRSGALYIFFPASAPPSHVATINEAAERMTWKSWKMRELEVEIPNVGKYKVVVYLKERDGYVTAVVPAESIKKLMEFAIENYYKRSSSVAV